VSQSKGRYGLSKLERFSKLNLGEKQLENCSFGCNHSEELFFPFFDVVFYVIIGDVFED
jgi:hypothetical protein